MGKKSVLAASLTGLFLIGSFPPFDFYPLAWIAFVPIFFALIGKRRTAAFCLVFISALIYFLESLHWLSIFGWYAWVGAALAQAAFPALWGALLPPFLKDTRLSFSDLCFPAVSFTAMEAVRNLGPMGFPWGDLVYSQWKFLPVIQFVKLFGSLGVCFLIVLFNTLIFYAIRLKKWKFAASGFCLLAAVLTFGFIELDHPPKPRAFIKVSVIQTNDLQSVKWGIESLPSVLGEMDTLVERAVKDHPNLVIFPETAVPAYLDDNPKLFHLILSWEAELKAPMAVGAFGRSEGRPQNEIILIDSRDKQSHRYDKIKLVPFGEYLPFLFKPLRGRWRALDPIVDLKPGDSYTVFNPPQGRFSTMICFESMFGRIARKFVLNGSELLTVATNDAWFFGTLAQEQHAEMSLIRGVETGRSVIQAGNTGISFFADPAGKILAWEDANRSAVLTASVPLCDSLTLYDRIGDFFPWLCIVLTAGVLFLKRKNLI